MRNRHATPFAAEHGELFVEDFDDGDGITVLDDDPADAPPPPEPAPPAPDLDALRNEAFAEGVRHAATAGEARRADAVERMATTLSAALQAQAAEWCARADASAEAIARAAFAAIAAALPSACARHGAAEIAALARTVLPGLARVPRTTIRVHPSDAPVISDVIADIDPDQRGRIELMPSDAIAPGDLRIAWDEGRAVRDTAALLAAIGETLAMQGLIGDPAEIDLTRATRRQHA